MGAAPGWRRLSAEHRRAVLKWCLQSSVGLAAYGAVLFLAAGRLDWLWGWVLLGLVAALLIGQPLLLAPIDPDLLVERAGGLRQAGGKTWDRWVASISGGMLPIASWIVAALDLRFGWSSPKPLGLHLFGLGLVAFGWTLFLWAMVSNAYFSEVVRIQEERGHMVATGGPYRVVRHPGYAGAILAFLGTALLLGSYWALVPAALGVGGYILRTALEDRTLRLELEGYQAYARKVPFRLIPGVW